VETSSGGSARTAVIVLCCAGAVMAFLDATIVNIAFPAIERDFHGTPLSSLSWVLNAYNVVIAAALVPAGRLGDRLGRRRMFSLGVGIFTVASAACAAAPSVWLLVAARVAQGLGAALLLPASLALLLPAFPPERRQAASGLWGAVAAAATGIGPTLGGVLIQWASWRWVFLVNLPVGALAMVAIPRVLREEKGDVKTRPDILGASLLAVAFGTLSLALVKGHEWGWTSGRVIAAFGVALVAVAGSAIHAPRHPGPVLDPALLRLRSVAAANAGTVLFATAFFATTLNNVLFLTGAWGWSVLHAGLAITPSPLIGAAVAGPAGRLADRYGPAPVIVPGALVYVAGVLMLHQLAPHGPDFWGHWLPGAAVVGVGVGLTFPTLGGAAMRDVPDGSFGVATALNSTARQLGAVLGVSLLVVVLSGSLRDPVAGAQHGWVLAAAAAALCGAVALALPRPRPRPD
jgi:NTE family protein